MQPLLPQTRLRATLKPSPPAAPLSALRHRPPLQRCSGCRPNFASGRPHGARPICSHASSSMGSSGSTCSSDTSTIGAPEVSSSDAGGCDATSSSSGGETSSSMDSSDAEFPQWFFEERRTTYNRMRHERDRKNKRERMRAIRAAEEARLAELTPEQRAAYEAEEKRLRVEASLAQKAAMAAALAGAGVRVVVDCSYATEAQELHIPRHGARAAEVTAPVSVRSLAKQIEIAMGMNRRSECPVALTLTSFRGDLASFADHIGARAWPIVRHEAHVLDVFDRSNIVMLTPDAETPLEGPLDPEKVYVIGGIVDKSVVKGLSMGWATAAGVATARLPVRELAAELGMEFNGAHKTPVLAISDVVVALLEAARTGGDWVAALEAALPERVRRAGVPGTGRRRRR